MRKYEYKDFCSHGEDLVRGRLTLEGFCLKASFYTDYPQ